MGENEKEGWEFRIYKGEWRWRKYRKDVKKEMERGKGRRNKERRL